MKALWLGRLARHQRAGPQRTVGHMLVHLPLTWQQKSASISSQVQLYGNART